MKKTIVFTTDCECFKKGDEITISTNTAFLMVNVEKVAKFKESKKEVKTEK